MRCGSYLFGVPLKDKYEVEASEAGVWRERDRERDEIIVKKIQTERYSERERGGEIT